MEPLVFFAVLAAAAMHAGWNAVVKVGLDPFLSIVLVALSSGAVALCLVPFVPVPGADVWPFLIASGALHVLYNLCLVQAYQAGDLGQIYPIARGAAPMLVALAGVLVLREPQTATEAAGIALLVSGVWLMAVRGGRGAALPQGRGILFALLTSLCIASYTLLDGIGARRADGAAVYAIYLFVIDGVLILALVAAMRGAAGFRAMSRAWAGGFAGGMMSLFAYWVVIWAMTRAPIPQVAALRETSVLFALAISSVMLRERPTAWRIAAGLLIVAGALALRLG
ncbi:MAG TPA: EamA family transporter [Geminicoccaceae bacterium]